MSTSGYPVVLRILGRRCVVIGGGEVATRKVGALVREGADLLVVAPEVSPEIERLEETGGITVERRPFEPADLDGAFLAIAATDSWAVNHQVVEEAQTRGVLINVTDDQGACDFTVPATVRRKDITLAVSTGGRSPAFSRYLREQLTEWLTDARFMLLELMAELRRDLRSAGRTVRPETWRKAAADEGVTQALADGDREGARRRLFEILMAGQAGAPAAAPSKPPDQRGSWPPFSSYTKRP
jgi:precorrin-2 dehydrogenase/sirohydrochlorin ferrochelatase